MFRTFINQLLEVFLLLAVLASATRILAFVINL
ncbi:hypothetical protein CPL00151_CDS0017 [Escherichia phage Delraymugoa]